MNKMPKKVINDYVFYKIVCLDNSVELCYVGSTANFIKRKSEHKNDCYNQNRPNYNSKIYKTIRDNGGWSNFKMIQLETREQLTIRQAEQIEEEYRVELKAYMNSKRCYLTEEQKREADKEYTKKYYDENRDKILEKQQKYYEENKDKILEQKQNYYDENKDKIKNYREANKDKILKYQQNYREENKDKINEKQKEKIKCECGCMVNKSSLLRHQKSPKHKKSKN